MEPEPKRCAWAESHPLLREYHDDEYGVPKRGDAELFELLSLELFQAGLSWLTILKKRDAFRAAFQRFEPSRVAAYSDADRARLLADAGIVRNRLKIDATIHNAAVVVDLAREHGSFAAWLDGQGQLSRDEWVRLFKRTFRFTGGEITNEFLLSSGRLPVRHEPGCWRATAERTLPGEV
jgi:DNA-3-methyladenine glycosylase I